MRRIVAYLRLSLALIDGKTGLLLAAVPALALVYTLNLASNFPRLTVMDLFIWSYDPTYGIPLLWLACPSVTMLILIGMWKKRSSYNIIVREGSRLSIWVSYLCDVVLVSCAVAILLHISLLICGVLSFRSLSNFDNPSSLFSFYTDGQLLEGFPFIGGFGLSFVYCLLALLLVNTGFCLANRFFKKPLIPFLIVSILDIPTIHSKTSIIYDIMRNFLGGTLVIQNPLSLVYESAGIFYGTWLPSHGHNLWLLALMFLCLATLGAFTRKHDYL
ncbi:MAG: hypothetical protein FWD72_02055 [Eggerthellaceae bacterium]|nr:hypothetical protein [Eggerthellaceae bacterium]